MSGNRMDIGSSKSTLLNVVELEQTSKAMSAFSMHLNPVFQNPVLTCHRQWVDGSVMVKIGGLVYPCR